MAKIALPIIIAVGLTASAFGNFSKSITFEASGYRGSATLDDFPVLVRLSTAIDGFDYAAFGTGTNLVFMDEGGNIMSHEVDTWDDNGVSLVWVRVPSLAATTTFTMFYGGESEAASDPAATWAGAGYVGVWHMDESVGAVADATGHGLAAAPAGDAAGIAASARYAGADAPVGHARQTGTSTAKGYLSAPSYDALGVGDSFTMSGWVRLTENVANSPRLFSRKDNYKSDNGWEIEMATASAANFNVRGAARDSNTCKGTFSPNLQNRWTHLAFVFDGAACTVYTNGHALMSGVVTPATDNGLPLSIGCDSDGTEQNIRGAFDECRILDAVASADWIAAEYATVVEDTFLVAGPVIDAHPAIGEVSVAPSATRASISVTIASPGIGATACDIYLTIAPSGGSFDAAARIAADVTGSFSYSIEHLRPETAYDYVLAVTNNAASPFGVAVSGSFTTKADMGSFERKVGFTVEYDGPGTPSGIPVLVRLSDGSPAGFAFRDCAEDGSDLRFFDEEGDLIPHEIDTWNPKGESLIWVNVPSAAKGHAFSMYYKGTPGTSGVSQSVWTGYTGVWHLNNLREDNPAIWQSQGIYPNSTATPSIDAHLSTNSIPGETGRFGMAFRVNDSPGWKQGNHNEGGAWVADSGADSPLDANGVFTISGWFKHADWNYNFGKLFFKRMNANNSGEPAGAFATQLGSGTWDNHVDAYGSGGNRVRATTDFSLKDTWLHLAFVFDGKRHTIYTNGAEAVSQNYRDTVVDNDAPLVFGNNVGIAAGTTGDCAWPGLIDEIRYLRTAQPAEWIAAEYAAMADEGFLMAGTVENTGARRTIIIFR